MKPDILDILSLLSFNIVFNSLSNTFLIPLIFLNSPSNADGAKFFVSAFKLVVKFALLNPSLIPLAVSEIAYDTASLALPAGSLA